MSRFHQGRSSAQRDKDRKRIAREKPGCHICGKPIDYSLHYLDPGAFVVDHLVPLSRGGLDEIANKRAAHRKCNDVKRARDYAPIVRRSGSLD